RCLDSEARARWEAGQAAELARERALERDSLDRVALGDPDSERAHALETSGRSYALSYRRNPGRDVRTGGSLAFVMRSAQPARALKLRYWGEEHRRRFNISINGVRIAHEVLDGGRGHDFVDVDYPLP